MLQNKEKVKVTYAGEVLGEYVLEYSPLDIQGEFQRRPGQSSTGYGRKITSDWVLKFLGKARSLRVYAICISNCSSHYVLKNGERLFLADYEFPDRT